MKNVIGFSMTTAAGAGTYAATHNRDGILTKNATYYKASKPQAIVGITIMGANALRIIMYRDGHQADDIYLPAIADTLADLKKKIPIKDLLDNAGIELLANEQLSMDIVVGGNATVNVEIELDDACQRTNVRGVYAAGANALNANVATETGANVVSGLNSNANYKPKATYITSTTMQSAAMGFQGGEIELLETQTAVVSGQPMYKLASLPTAKGEKYKTDFVLLALGSAADAANTQVIFVLFETD